MALIIGSILGFISVAFGAYAEHGLKNTISLKDFETLSTAIRYNQLYAVIIIIIGLFLLIDNKLTKHISLKLSALAFILGVILFSFSIYCSVIFTIPEFTKLAPIGGTTIMLGWILLLIFGIVSKLYR